MGGCFSCSPAGTAPADDATSNTQDASLAGSDRESGAVAGESEVSRLLNSRSQHAKYGSGSAAPKVSDAQRRQEMLKKIVQQTAENLIDISSIRLLDRIQQDVAAERSKEYQAILQSLPPLTPTSKSKIINQQPKPVSTPKSKHTISSNHVPALTRLLNALEEPSSSSSNNVNDLSKQENTGNGNRVVESSQSDDTNEVIGNQWEQDLKLMDSAVELIRDAMEDFHIAHMGDVVVPLKI